MGKFVFSSVRAPSVLHFFIFLWAPRSKEEEKCLANSRFSALSKESQYFGLWKLIFKAKESPMIDVAI